MKLKEDQLPPAKKDQEPSIFMLLMGIVFAGCAIFLPGAAASDQKDSFIQYALQAGFIFMSVLALGTWLKQKKWL